MSSAREQLLARVVDHLAGHGVGDASLREIGAAVGSSHRMLLHHFGSREGLLAAVVGAVEAEQRAVLAEVFAGAEPAPAGLEELADRYWRAVAAAAQRYGGLFFELAGQAINGQPHAARLREDLVAAWLPGVVELLTRLGVSPEQAEPAARLAVAGTRGLLLDLLVTGEREAVDRSAALFHRMLDQLLLGAGPISGPGSPS